MAVGFCLYYIREAYITYGGKDSEKMYFYKSQKLLNYTQPRLFTNRVTSFHKLQYVATKITKYFLLVYIKCVEILNRLSTHKRPIESRIAKLVQRGSLNFYWPNISAAPFYYICIEKTIIEKTLLGNGELLGIINVRKWRHYLGLDIVSEFHLYFFWAQYMQYFLGYWFCF